MLLVKGEDESIPTTQPRHVVYDAEPCRVVERVLDRGERIEHLRNRGRDGALKRVLGGNALPRQAGLHRRGREEGEEAVDVVLLWKMG